MKNKQRKILKIFIVLTVIVLIIILLYFSVINSAILSSTKLTLDSIAKKAINQSITNITSNRAVYNDMIDIRYKETGDISLIQVKAYEANQICMDIVEATEKNIKVLGKEGIKLRSGIFSAIPILSGIGNNISLNFRQIGAVNCIYHSKFETAGINQNIHKLYVEVSTRIGIVFPFHTEIVDVSQKILLCENVIVGEVPYTYLQSTELDSLLNLVPS